MQTITILDKLNNYSKLYKPKQFTVEKVQQDFKTQLSSTYIPKQSANYFSTLESCYKIRMGNMTIYTSIPNTSHKHKKLATFCSFFASFLEYAFQKEPRPLTIYYFPDPTLGNKKVVDSIKPLSPTEINSGLNYGNTIIVYRKQEAPKVLIHELVHAYGLDHGVDIHEPLITSSVPIRFTETYTELLASILFVEFSRRTDRATAFDKMFAHFKVQSDKIMCMYNYRKGTNFAQDTHVYEYIIAKSALCQHLGADINRVSALLCGPKVTFNAALTEAIQKYMDQHSCGFRALPKSI